MVKQIDAKDQMSVQNSKIILEQIDGLFTRIFEHIAQKLSQSKSMICDDINRRFKTNDHVKQNIIGTMDSPHS